MLPGPIYRPNCFRSEFVESYRWRCKSLFESGGRVDHQLPGLA